MITCILEKEKESNHEEDSTNYIGTFISIQLRYEWTDDLSGTSGICT